MRLYLVIVKNPVQRAPSSESSSRKKSVVSMSALATGSASAAATADLADGTEGQTVDDTNLDFWRQLSESGEEVALANVSGLPQVQILSRADPDPFESSFPLLYEHHLGTVRVIEMIGERPGVAHSKGALSFMGFRSGILPNPRRHLRRVPMLSSLLKGLTVLVASSSPGSRTQMVTWLGDKGWGLPDYVALHITSFFDVPRLVPREVRCVAATSGFSMWRGSYIFAVSDKAHTFTRQQQARHRLTVSRS